MTSAPQTTTGQHRTTLRDTSPFFIIYSTAHNALFTGTQNQTTAIRPRKVNQKMVLEMAAYLAMRWVRARP